MLSFDLNEILLETEQGMMMVKGTDLHVNRLSLEKGSGPVRKYRQRGIFRMSRRMAKQQENIFSKLFR